MLRLLADKSQMDVYEQAGISQWRYRRIEEGKTDATEDEAKVLARVLRVTVDRLPRLAESVERSLGRESLQQGVA